MNIAINFSFSFNLCCLTLGMVQEGFGHIINISSIWGKAAPSNRSPYSSAKFALIGLMDSVRYEVIIMSASSCATFSYSVMSSNVETVIEVYVAFAVFVVEYIVWCNRIVCLVCIN